MSTIATPASSPTSRALNMVLWVLQVLMALAFLGAGISKLTGAEEMVKNFDTIGLGQWFRYLTGGLEVLCAILLLIPRFSGVGALLLVGVMVGAVLAHLTRLGGSPAPAVVFLVVVSVIAWGRRRQTLALLGLAASQNAVE